ncbi:hypothetical protein pipiens_012831 [Culex pipiens pipiens]|uniref:Uncharacterized protein n=1 Tax=Culex pipiens pipiens TaxID=38569 RepID=A0ABD1D0S7_CULPP
MGVWRSRPALAYDPDVESGIRDDEDDLAELAVAYFERLNELNGASVVHEPRSLAELAFAAIPVTEPLDDWTSNQMETSPHFETGKPNLFGNTEISRCLSDSFGPRREIEGRGSDLKLSEGGAGGA